MFAQKLFFGQFRLIFRRSGGVRGHGMEKTTRFPRTLAGFGLTWHGGSRFSWFLEISETHFIMHTRAHHPNCVQAHLVVPIYCVEWSMHTQCYFKSCFACALRCTLHKFSPTTHPLTLKGSERMMMHKTGCLLMHHGQAPHVCRARLWCKSHCWWGLCQIRRSNCVAKYYWEICSWDIEE